ncbi:EAL and HDOD domain-containing protein [Desulfoluna spongiiphila]|uniref:EAL and modified HD-GYP domain-containing signal transduction protein n=1 Tax=Desulfoluna spongiiphila TaxID=419481 RepID=A0A1G5IQ18_9BACT|nr:EAL domain-containing protein [Desulfoluna spongiiphila]SCY77841.1 EAL and modified HD-GYP domain-containing signal transduction protein [Desulfoluna spongiiphila]VVS92592.1 metal-dependent hydrolase hdod [Desulfoluna spongiiphila]
MDTHIARQPIFDTHTQVYGYELLFRNGRHNAMPEEMDGDRATSQLLSSSFFTIGIDTLTNGKYAFINFTEKLINTGIPSLFPWKQTVIEVLETVPATAEVIRALTVARAKGYTVALDDFVLDAASSPFLDVADIIKVDLLDTPAHKVEALAHSAREKGITLLAEKVESKEVFTWASELGFTLFQGYFFCRPEIISGKEIPADSLTLLRLVAEINRTDVDVEAVERLVVTDVAIVFKLLSHLNSAWYGLKAPVSSLREALRMLGLDEVRRLVGLIAMGNISAGVPTELLRVSAVRGRLCELAVGRSSLRTDPTELFTLGIFSLIDTILHRPMEEVLSRLPLSPATVAALTRGTGPQAPFLRFAKAFEQGQWDEMAREARTVDLPERHIGKIITDTLSWNQGLPV